MKISLPGTTIISTLRGTSLSLSRDGSVYVRRSHQATAMDEVILHTGITDQSNLTSPSLEQRIRDRPSGKCGIDCFFILCFDVRARDLAWQWALRSCFRSSLSSAVARTFGLICMKIDLAGWVKRPDSSAAVYLRGATSDMAPYRLPRGPGVPVDSLRMGLAIVRLPCGVCLVGSDWPGGRVPMVDRG